MDINFTHFSLRVLWDDPRVAKAYFSLVQSKLYTSWMDGNFTDSLLDGAHAHVINTKPSFFLKGLL